MATATPGVKLQAGVVLTSGASRFVANLRGVVPASVPITVTSGSRTIPEQASAMLKKWKAGGAKELYAVYGSDATITKLLAVEKSVAAWTAVLERELAKGVRISRHIVGNTSPGAIDLHTKTLTSAQVGLLKKGVEQLGGRALIEAAPPHMHVDLPAMERVMDVAEQAAVVATETAKKVFPWTLVLGGVAAVVLIGVGRRRHAQAAERAA